MYWCVMVVSGNGFVDEIGLLAIDEWLKLAPHVEHLRFDRVRMNSKSLPTDTQTWVFPLAPWPDGRLEAIR